MELSANGLRVLVTAGGSGIGRAVAETFTKAGARVHISDIDGKFLAEAHAALFLAWFKFRSEEEEWQQRKARSSSPAR